VQEFQRQHIVDCGRVVPVSLHMAVHDGFKVFPFNVRSRKSTRIQEHLTNIAGLEISIPDSIMIELVPAEEEALKMKGR
jgi:hypothetical protein